MYSRIPLLPSLTKPPTIAGSRSFRLRHEWGWIEVYDVSDPDARSHIRRGETLGGTEKSRSMDERIGDDRGIPFALFRPDIIFIL